MATKKTNQDAAVENTAAEVKEDFGWGDSVPVEEPVHVLLPEGPAAFAVLKLERQRREFGKFGVCNVAAVRILVQTAVGDGHEEAEVVVNLPLVRSMAWKILQLATSCGLRKAGGSNEVDPRWWGKFGGASGVCTMQHREYQPRNAGKDDKPRVINDVKSFDPPPSSEGDEGAGGGYAPF